MQKERIVCQWNDYTVITAGPDPLDNLNEQTLAGVRIVKAIVRDYASKGYRVVTPDYFDRGRFRTALQGSE